MHSRTRIIGHSISAAAGIVMLMALPMGVAKAQDTLIDTHVHLHHRKVSLEANSAPLATANLEPGTAGITWRA